MAETFEPFAMQGTVMVNRVSQTGSYIRKVLMGRKSITIIGLKGVVNLLDSLENLQSHAAKFSYPFMLMQGSEDNIVSNKRALHWYD